MIRSIVTLNIDTLIIALGHMCKVAQLKLHFCILAMKQIIPISSENDYHGTK